MPPFPSSLKSARLALLSGFVASLASARQAPPGPAQIEIDTAIDRGAKFLLGACSGRLETGKFVPPERIGQTALTLYTLQKAGMPKDDPTVRKLLTRVLGAQIDRTYDASCAILALNAHDPIDERRWIEELARKLVDWQLPDGHWAYPAGAGDLSNTQYAALGLWVAAADGVAIDASVWTKLADAVLRDQSPDGGFGYVSAGGTGGSGSMTAAGIGTLAMCENRLRCAGTLEERLAARLASSRARGLEWLARNFSVSENPKGGAWLHYYLYGLERLGAVTGISRIGGRDWYGEGAAFLVSQQDSAGSWQHGTDLSATCFAVLFLERATSARRTPVTGGPSSPIEVPLRISAGGVGAVLVSVAEWNRQLARELEWPGERGRGPRATRVEYFVDDRLCAVALGDPARASQDLGATLVFETAGLHRLKARAFVLVPGDGSGKERMLESQTLEFEAARALPRWTPELALELGPDLALDAKAKVEASSRAGVGDTPLDIDFLPSAVVDGCGATPWLAALKDERRTLTITFGEPPTCDTVRISPAVLPALGSRYLSRPIELEVSINGKDKQRLAMDPDPLHAMRIELEHKTRVQRIDVKLTSIAASEACALAGIGEVELFLRK